jgi:hypothetical protein
MNIKPVVLSLAATALLVSLGLGRAVAQSNEAAAHQGMMDMKAMCDMHRKMMSKGSTADREAMAGKEMKGMPAEQKQQHMKMMDEQCR